MRLKIYYDTTAMNAIKAIFLCTVSDVNLKFPPKLPSHDSPSRHKHCLWAAGLTRCLSLTVFFSQEGGSLVDSTGVLRLPFYTAWLELNQKEVTLDL